MKNPVFDSKCSRCHPPSTFCLSSVMDHYPSSLECFWLTCLILRSCLILKSFITCSINSPDAWIDYHTFHKHTSLSKLVFIGSADMLLTSKLAYVLFRRCLEVFLKITSTFLLSWVPVYTDKDQRLAAMSIGLMLNNRPKVDAVVWSGPKKNCNYSFMLFVTLNCSTSLIKVRSECLFIL